MTYRRLWRRFYDTIAIRERENPRCRMTNMPKRFWGTMTEFQPDEGALPAPGPRGRMVKKAQRLENTPGAAPYLQSFLSGQPRLSRKI